MSLFPPSQSAKVVQPFRQLIKNPVLHSGVSVIGDINNFLQDRPGMNDNGNAWLGFVNRVVAHLHKAEALPQSDAFVGGLCENNLYSIQRMQ
ncbi:hypothetical protein TNCV_2793701 [Trichonephila clavipes]|nr:hypothetical protein TNCV_2793701 [Trichonephila clavipes]